MFVKPKFMKCMFTKYNWKLKNFFFILFYIFYILFCILFYILFYIFYIYFFMKMENVFLKKWKNFIFYFILYIFSCRIAFFSVVSSISEMHFEFLMPWSSNSTFSVKNILFYMAMFYNVVEINILLSEVFNFFEASIYLRIIKMILIENDCWY